MSDQLSVIFAFGFNFCFIYTGRLTTTSPPSKEPDKQGPKGWVIAVAVVSCLAVVGLFLGGLIWWKWRMTSPGVAYEKQHDEEGAQ